MCANQKKRKRSKIGIIVSTSLVIIVLLCIASIRNFILNHLTFFSPKIIKVVHKWGSGDEEISLKFSNEDDLKILSLSKKYYIERRFLNTPVFSHFYSGMVFYKCYDTKGSQYSICFNDNYSATIVSDQKDIKKYCYRVNSIKSKIPVQDFDDWELYEFICFHLENHYDYFCILTNNRIEKTIAGHFVLFPEKKKAVLFSGNGDKIYSVSNIRDKDIKTLKDKFNKSNFSFQKGNLHYHFIIGKEKKTRTEYIRFIEIDFVIAKDGSIYIDETYLTDYYPVNK